MARRDYGGHRHATERLISSGTTAGMLAGLAIGAVAFALAGLMISGAIIRLDESPGTSAWFSAIAVVMVAAGVNSAVSGVMSRRARRAGQRVGFDGELAGETTVWNALKAGRTWALVLVIGYGAALVVGGIAAVVAGEAVGIGDVAASLIVSAFGAGLMYAAVRVRENPKWLDED